VRQKALQIKPDYQEARKFLYGMYLQDKDYDGAINSIKAYLRINDKDIPNLIALGDVYLLKGDGAQARERFRKVIDLEPDKPQGYYQMAILEVKSKNLPEALKYTDKALQVEPNFLPALQLKVRIFRSETMVGLAAARQIRPAVLKS
jgi:tetratricopeptide (TPR) repeat protein